ncbi:sulfatase [Streptomyces sp. NPDC020731]|uniref:sulfatase n=1 Tax=Streptomyces sp. NPDC020731 TaxID=3365085 RepID=UPI0037AE1CA0
MHDTTQLRRLPWREGDRPAFVSPGDGIVNRLADALEAELIETAQTDATRARGLADDAGATPPELRTALRFVAHSVEEAVLVAVLRGERLGLGLDSPEVPDGGQTDRPGR